MDYVVSEDFMKAVRKVSENERLRMSVAIVTRDRHVVGHVIRGRNILCCSMASRPSTRDVVKALKTLNLEKTRNLVLHLGVPSAALDDIKEEFIGDTRKEKYVEKWLDIDTSASWKRLVSGLREIDMHVLAAEVESEYKTTEAPPPTFYTISTPAQLEAAPLHVIASTPPPTPANSQVPAARVGEVRASIEYFEEEFSEVTVELQIELSKKEKQDCFFFERFQGHLLALPAAKKGIHVKFFIKTEDDILEATKIKKLLAILNRYCNYSNYEITFIVIKKFCGKPLQQKMLAYKESHVEFERNTTVDVYLCAISAPPESNIFVGYTKMAMKINKPSNVCTLYEIRQLKESIARNASLHSHSMYIEVPEEGSVRVVLRFPEECGWSVARVMTAEFMETHQLTDVTFDGEDLKSYLVSHSVV